MSAAGAGASAADGSDADLALLAWSGWIKKKAFKTLSKQNWKRRWCVFSPATLTLSWHASETTKSLGEFVMNPVTVSGEPTNEHMMANELKISSTGDEDGAKEQIFYGCTEHPKERLDLIKSIDIARRYRIAGADDKQVKLSAKSSMDVSDKEPGAKVFSWGGGHYLGNGMKAAQCWSLPQRIHAIKAPAPVSVTAGPEHAGCLDAEGNLHMWGSNEFTQSGPLSIASDGFVWKPVPMAFPGEGGARRSVVTFACGGSHTLAVLASAPGAKVGPLVAWGTGTLGQLGLKSGTLLCDTPTPVPLPSTRGAGGGPVLVSRVAAGLISSAAVTSTGECFVWGDASLGRLGLPDIPDSVDREGKLIPVNFKIVWEPTQLRFTAAQVGVSEEAAKGRAPTVAHVVLGGSFSMFMVYPPGAAGGAAGGPAGCVLLVCGALGVDITRDHYAFPEDLLRPAEGDGGKAPLEAVLDNSHKEFARVMTPNVVTPFGNNPIVLAMSASARHAAVVAAVDGLPRAYTAGVGWMGHAGTKTSLILPQPSFGFFAPASGPLADTSVVGIATGHSHTIVHTAKGQLFSWGRGDSGELGHGNLVDAATPRLVRSPPGHKWTAVSGGSYFSTAIAEPASADAVEPPNSVTLEKFRAQFAALVAQEDAEIERVSPAPKPVVVVAAAAVAAPAAAAAVVATPAAPAADAAEVPLPEGWDWGQADDGAIYFIQPNGDTTWDDPRLATT